MKKLIAIALSLLVLPMTAVGATFTGTATVNIQGVPINITPVQPLQFGSLTRPTTSGASYRVASDGTKVATNIVQTDVANVQPAKYTIDAPSGTVHLQIFDETSTVGLSLSNFDFNYAGVEHAASSGSGLPAGTGVPLVIGAQANVGVNTLMGVSTMAYNVQVDYE